MKKNTNVLCKEETNGKNEKLIIYWLKKTLDAKETEQNFLEKNNQVGGNEKKTSIVQRRN